MGGDVGEVIAAELYEAWRKRTPVRPVTERYPGLSVSDAYLIQLAVIEKRVRAGEKVVGWKVGLTSQAMQELLGVHEPDFGHLTAEMIVPDGGRVSRATLIQPKVEAEICFVLARDLRGPGVQVEDVRAATEAVCGALEIIDSRIADWKVKIQDTVADNASAGLAVIGGARRDLRAVDPKKVRVVVEKNEAVAGESSGAAVMGDPAAAVAWLANKLAGFGEYLRAGQLILPGAVAAAFAVAPGDFVRASFDGLGSVSVSFVA